MLKLMKILYLIILLILTTTNLANTEPNNYDLTIARLQYGGGGDWYNDPDIIPNLCHQIRSRTNINTNDKQAIVNLSDEELFSYPFLFITGHGNIKFTETEIQRLRTHLTNGGFLYADDDYGMDKPFRREMKRVFPDKDFVELPFDHPIYHTYYDFPNGLPKIHEHDGGPPKGLGLFHEERLIVFYSGNTDLGDGWEDPDVHKDPENVRRNALKMGANIVIYALTH